MPIKKDSTVTPKKPVTPVTPINPVKKNVTDINFSGNNFDNIVHHHFGGHGHGGGWGGRRWGGYGGYGYPAGYLGYPPYYNAEPIIIAQAPEQAPAPAQTTTSAQAKTSSGNDSGISTGFIIGAVVVLIAGGLWWNSTHKVISK